MQVKMCCEERCPETQGLNFAENSVKEIEKRIKGRSMVLGVLE